MNRFAMVLAVSTFVIGSAAASDVAVRYSLSPYADAGDFKHGRITLQVENLSGAPLEDVSVRLAVPGAGQLAGAILDVVDLSTDQIVVLEGEYLLEPAVIESNQEMVWHVSYRRDEATIQDEVVTGLRQD